MKARYVTSLLGMVVAVALMVVGRTLFKQMDLPLALTVTAIVVGIAVLVKRRNPAPAEESEESNDTGEKF